MNDQKDSRKRFKNEMPVVDDGWWESVLADEQKYSSSHSKPVTPVPVEPAPVNDLSDVRSESVDWDSVKQFYKNDRIIEMKVTGHNRGGLLVEGDGLAGFVPLSHLIDMAGRENERNNSLEEYLGRDLKVKVIECVPEDERIIFSERAALSEPGKRVELFHTLSPGMQVKGVVTNITDFGVFIDLGGVEGLIHISELSWGRVAHPGNLVQLGEEIDVQVLDISAERCRVALSRKRLLSNPWESALAEFPKGRVISATVTNVLSYGAFASLDAGVEGLIHATEMPLADGQSPRDILAVGQRLDLRVLHVDPAHQRLGFSMKLDNE